MGAGRHFAVAFDLLLAAHVASLLFVSTVSLSAHSVYFYSSNAAPLWIALIVHIVHEVLGAE